MAEQDSTCASGEKLTATNKPLPPTVDLIGLADFKSATGDSCIYVLWCRETFYVGSAVNLKRRLGYHIYRLSRKTHPNPKMQAAWNVHGIGQFHFGTLETVPEATLIQAEQRWLDLLQCGRRRDCFNHLTIANSHRGVRRSPETCAKISAAKLARPVSPSLETRELMRAAKIGRKLSAEHKIKIGNASRGKPCNRPLGIINKRLRKFSDSQVRQMRIDRCGGMSWSKLKLKYGVNLTALISITSRKTYRDVL